MTTHLDPGCRSLHDVLATYGEDALRTAFDRGLAEQAMGAEYIARDVRQRGVTTPYDCVQRCLPVPHNRRYTLKMSPRSLAVMLEALT